MAHFIRRHNIVITAILLLVCSFQLMSASIQDPSFAHAGSRFVLGVLAPFERAYLHVHDNTRFLWNHYFWLMNVEQENKSQRAHIKALEAENSKLIEFRGENERLRKLLHFIEKTSHKGVAAAVVGRDPSNWIRTVTINQGKDQGIKSAMPVVDGRAVIGQTTAVSEQSSKVLLLTDSRSAIDAIVQRTRASGIVQGTLSDTLKLRYVLKGYDVKPGDQVITSGLDGVFPKATLIGVVTAVHSDTLGLFHEVELQPSVDLNRLENVLVLTKQQVSDD